jgi:hypothetical protein
MGMHHNLALSLEHWLARQAVDKHVMQWHLEVSTHRLSRR